MRKTYLATVAALAVILAGTPALAAPTDPTTPVVPSASPGPDDTAPQPEAPSSTSPPTTPGGSEPGAPGATDTSTAEPVTAEPTPPSAPATSPTVTPSDPGPSDLAPSGPADADPAGPALAAAAVSDTLAAPNSLYPGQSLVSRNGKFRLTVQADGNVGIFPSTGGAIWASMTPGPDARVTVQADGNVGFFGGWVRETRTAGTGSQNRLVMRDDGVLALYSAQDVLLWSTTAGRTPSELSAPHSLYPGQSLVSPGGGYRLTVQADGNVGIFGPNGRATWASMTPGKNARVTVQADGNVGFFGDRVLETRTAGTGSRNRLAIRDDGVLAVVGADGIEWWTNVAGPLERNLGSAVTAPAIIRPGQYLTSPNGTYRMAVQADGNVGVFPPTGRAIWASMTPGQDGRVVVGGDGNLGFIGGGNALLSNTNGSGAGHRLTLQDNGALVLMTVGDVPVWSTQGGRTGNTRSSIAAGNVQVPGQALVSDDGRIRAAFGRDGNYGVFTPGGAVWASMTPGANARVSVQTDGNVGFFGGGRVLETATNGSGSRNALTVQNDGNLVLYAGTTALWSTKGGLTPSGYQGPMPVFAYGTLRPNQSAWGRVSGFVRLHQGGWMADLSMYYSADRRFPWAVPGGAGIVGDLLMAHPGQYDRMITTMDAYERYNPNLPPDNQNYVRQVRTTGSGFRTWIYVTGPRQAVYVRGSLPWIASGDWTRR